MGIATIVERLKGTEFAATYIYGAWWFVALWALLAICSVIMLVRKRLAPATLMLHISFLGILAGAFVTYLTAERGSMHLRVGVPDNILVEAGTNRISMLPFTLELTDFHIVNYPGTDAPMDYVSTVAPSRPDTYSDVINIGLPRGEEFFSHHNEMQAMQYGVETHDGHPREKGDSNSPSLGRAGEGPFQISMNNIASIDGYRFYQSSYDEDMQGTHLLVSHDPYGIAVTYTSYIMLFLSLIAVFVKKIKKRVTVAALLLATSFTSTYANGPSKSPLKGDLTHGEPFCTILPALASSPFKGEREGLPTADIAHDLGKVAVLYNNRICPLNTAATDFVQKLSGKATWQGLSADEIFVGWMIYYDYWEKQPIIRIKNEEVQQIIGINGSWASLRNFYSISNEYKLQKYLNDASQSISTRKAIREADEKVRIISMFYAGEFIKIFPLNNHWYSPGSTQLPKNTPTKEFQFIKRVMDQVVQATLVNDTQTASTLIAKIRNYQREHAPIPYTLGVEVVYNKILTQRWPIMLFLTASLILCIVTIMRKNSLNMHKALLTLQIMLFAYTFASIILRWIISGHIPLSNGFETMQFMACAIITITLLMRRRTPLLNPLGPVVSSFALLVSMIACGSPQLTPLMPVLQSPFMSIHVMMVMLAYSLFAILALLAIQALVTKQGAETVTSLSKQLLYPSVALLAIGIFIGAVWANVSWGRYWGWDPKETWALITLMIYAIPLHKTFFPYSDRTYHWYILVSFLAVLMTYFGVNYLLPGMHSYA